MNIAVVGCGYWGRHLVRNFYDLGVLSIVCDGTDDGRVRARQLAPDVRVCARMTEVLDSSVDAVAIATPAETHSELALKALEAGKDVFVEKPLALTYAEGNDLVGAARTAGRILMVGHVLEYHPAIQRLREIIQSGALGNLQYMYSTRVSLGKIRREENILWSFAPHDIAIMLRLAGSLPWQVSACGGHYVQPNIADVTVSNLFFKEGVRAHIHVSWLHPFKEQRLIVIGSRRMASFDDVAKQLVLYDQRVEIHEGEPVPIRGTGENISFADDEPLRAECQAFIDAITTRTPPLTDGLSGLRVLKVLELAQRSLEGNGVPVMLSGEDTTNLSTADV